MANVTKINVEERDYTISTVASLVSYDSSTSGLDADNIQDVIDEVNEKFISNDDLSIVASDNLANKTNIIEGKYITNTGNIANGSDWSYIRIVIKPNTNYTFGGFYLGRTGYFVFHDTNDAKIELSGTSQYAFKDPNGFLSPKTITTPSNAAYLLFDIKSDSSTIPQDWQTPYDELMLCEGNTLPSFKPYYSYVNKIKGYELKVPNSQIEDIVNPLLSTSLQQYVQHSDLTEYIDNNDLTLEPSGKNLADKTNNIVEGKYISNTGNITNGSDWSYIRIAIKPNTDYTFGGFYLGRAGYFVFRDSNDAKIELSGTSPYIFSDPKGFLSPKTLTSPNNAAYLLFNIKSNSSTIPQDWETPYDELMICEGNTLPSFEPFMQEISKIKGYAIKGSNNSGGSSEDGGESETPTIENLLADLPVSDGTNIETGYAYIDSTNYTIKVKI